MKCQMIPWWGKWMLEIAQLLTIKETLINKLTNCNRWMFHWHEKHVNRCVVQEDKDANVPPDQIRFEIKVFQGLWVFKPVICWVALIEVSRIIYLCADCCILRTNLKAEIWRHHSRKLLGWTDTTCHWKLTNQTEPLRWIQLIAEVNLIHFLQENSKICQNIL